MCGRAWFLAGRGWGCGRMSEVLVIGGGPAGLAAAGAVRECGGRVCLVDENGGLGGQIWRGELRRAADGVDVILGKGVVDVPAQGVAKLVDGSLISYERLIIATGARELLLPFPGWTLPGVCGAGGLQAMAKGGLRVRGKRVVVAGTGPLLVAVAAGLRAMGAEVVGIVEQAGWGAMLGFAVGDPGKWLQGLGLGARLAGVPVFARQWVTRALGEEGLRGVVLSGGRELACDYLGCGYGLVGNTELARLLGCRLDGGFVGVDEWQETNVAGVYCAGEPCGIGGVEWAEASGRVAGYAAAGDRERARKWFGARDGGWRAVGRLREAYGLREEVKKLAEANTVVCRCEDVCWGELEGFAGMREAKLATRCGMGACQGRVCGAALGETKGWELGGVRPPVGPGRLRNLWGE